MPDLHFQTAVSGEHEGVHYIRDRALSELVTTHSFPAVIYYMITGEMPDVAQEKMLNAILIASCDHGIAPSSGFVPRVVASTGNNLAHSMAAGLLTLGPYHGLAINEAAETITQVRERGLESLTDSHFAVRRRVMGLGHPHYKHTDPRSDQLFAFARELGISTRHQEIMLEIQRAVFENLGKHLVVNVDGAIAAILLDIGFPPAAGNGLFAFARAGGMIAHILEEYQAKPVRRLENSDIEFRRPERHITEEK